MQYSSRHLSFNLSRSCYMIQSNEPAYTNRAPTCFHLTFSRSLSCANHSRTMSSITTILALALPNTLNQMHALYASIEFTLPLSYFHKQRARLAQKPNQFFNTTSANTNFTEPAPSIASTTPSPPTNLTHSHHADAVNGYCCVSRLTRSYLPSTITRPHIAHTRPSVLDPNLAKRWPSGQGACRSIYNKYNLDF